MALKTEEGGHELSNSLKASNRASPVAQRRGICLPMQGTRFDPQSGKSPHAEERLGPAEPTHCNH